MGAKLERCVSDVKGQGKSESSAWAICKSQLKESADYPWNKCIKQQTERYGSAEKARKICGSIRASELVETDDKLFLKAFLLDSSINQNMWGVSPDTLDENIKTYIGKPLVIDETFGHPEVEDANYDHQLQYQERFRIGNIDDIVKNSEGIYNAIIEITDPYAKDAFKLGELPQYVSPSLFHDGVETEADDDTRTWRGLHLAIVDQPAFGAKKARITGQCSGKSDTCLAQLKRAKCNFCIKRTIDNFKAKYKVATNNKEEPDTSHIKKTQTKSIMSEQQEIKISEEEFAKLKQANEVLITENKNLKEANEKLTADNTSISERISKVENEARNEKVANILSGCFFKDDEARKAAHEAYVKSGMTYEQIEQVTESLRHIKSGKTEPTKVPIKVAKTEGNSLPDFYLSYQASTGGNLS